MPSQNTRISIMDAATSEPPAPTPSCRTISLARSFLSVTPKTTPTAKPRISSRRTSCHARKDRRRHYKDAAASSIVIMSVGTPAKFSGSRLDMLAGKVGIVRGCIQELMAEGLDGVLLIAMNPVDVLTLSPERSPVSPPSRVISSGTLLDTERLRHILGKRLNMDPRSVHAAVIGEHGDSSVGMWSAAQVAGGPLPRLPGSR